MTQPNRAEDPNRFMRAFLAVATTVQTLVFIVVFGMGPWLPGITHRMQSSDAKAIVELVLPVLSGYVGLIVGFYFGTKETNH